MTVPLTIHTTIPVRSQEHADLIAEKYVAIVIMIPARTDCIDGILDQVPWDAEVTVIRPHERGHDVWVGDVELEEEVDRATE